MRIAKQYHRFNAKRYSNPWIAKVVAWDVGKQPKLEFGGWLGNSEGGGTEIEAEPGDVIRYGQRDYRGSSTVNEWAIVSDAGQLLPVSQHQAREHWLSHHVQAKA